MKPKIVTCACGRKVEIDPRAYEEFCLCGQRFNSVGQMLVKYCCQAFEQGFDCGCGESND